jgi:YidC/Oxa1 family membrane protein insertase
MDRNSAIGLTLIAAMMVVYFFWISPPQKQLPQPVTPTKNEAASTVPQPAVKPAVPDSALTASYGDLAGFFNGEEKLTTIETEDLKVNLSNKGGIIQYVELKKFKTYSKKPSAGKPLVLIEPSSNSFSLQTKFKR